MTAALAALRFLTIAGRFGAASTNSRLIGLGAVYFPVVGLMLGLTLVFINRILEPHLESEILAGLLISVLAVMTGAVHLEGTKKIFDALSELSHAGDRSAHSVGVFGFLAVLFLVLFKIRALEVSGDLRDLSLVVTPVLARWVLVVFLCGASSAADETVRSTMENVNGWHLLIATAATLLFAILLTGRVALWIAFYLSLSALLSRAYLRRYRGGYTYDHLGALVECSEALGFVLFATL